MIHRLSQYLLKSTTSPVDCGHPWAAGAQLAAPLTNPAQGGDIKSAVPKVADALAKTTMTTVALSGAHASDALACCACWACLKRRPAASQCERRVVLAAKPLICHGMHSVLPKG